MHSDIKYWHLRNHKLFSILSNSQIEELCVLVHYKKALKGEIIYFSEDLVRRIYFLKKGAIKIAEMDESGNEVIREILKPGDLFGELALDSSGESGEYAQAMTKEVYICSFLLDDFERLLQRYPAVALGFTKIVGFRLKRMKNNYMNLVFKDVRSRLLTFLREWIEKEGLAGTKSVKLENYLTHQDIAGLVCSSRQTVTQLLNELEQEGILIYSRREIVVPDTELLAG